MPSLRGMGSPEKSDQCSATGLLFYLSEPLSHAALLPITVKRKPDEAVKLPAATICVIGNNIRSRPSFVLIPPLLSRLRTGIRPFKTALKKGFFLFG
jgi:hypothetical protein